MIRDARIWFLCAALLAGCGKKAVHQALPNTAAPYLGATGPNVLAITVGAGTVCGQHGYVNEPCTTVHVCVPGTDNCQEISDVLVDTGSVGLRVFSSALNIPLAQINDSGGNTLAECAQFGTGSAWGPLASADVVLGGESPVNVSIQIINTSYATIPSGCNQVDSSPQQAGYNGILGVGLFTEDCGPLCAANTSARTYFSCNGDGNGSTCTSTAVPVALQPQNPVAHLPTDNNGVVIAMSQVDPEGSARASGVLILGIETAANNLPIQVNPYSTDGNGEFMTELSGQFIPGSFIDSGSNGLFFPNVAGLAGCSNSGPTASFYCMSSPQELTATNSSATQDGKPQASVPFTVGNAESLVSGDNLALLNLAGTSAGGFDWGLPFFYGRAVFTGIQGRTSSMGTGPYFAY